MADVNRQGSLDVAQGGVDHTLCPISRSTQIVGDRWTILLLRELSFGNARFDQLLIQAGATPQMLASRLKRLEAGGLITRKVYQARPLRHEYRLTAKGRAFVPVLLALRAWGEQWCKTRGEPLAMVITHSGCGGEVGFDGVCAVCGRQVGGAELLAAPSPQYAEERLNRVRAKTRQPGGEAYQ
jgi:DNA-binding HxlR family transcriptional regulator